MNFTYEKVVVGGTFDRFHLGHQKLINTAFEQSSHVTIGLTRPVMYQKKVLFDLIEEYEVRKERLLQYLEEKEYLSRSIIIPIDDIYGNTLTEKEIEAIFVTEENVPNVEKINTKRKEIGFSEIKMILVPYVKAADGANITSERMRKGDIDREGYIYKSLFVKPVLTMPESLRPALQQPIGTVIENTAGVLHLIEGKVVIAVGDIISEELRQKNVHPAISVIDFKTRRHELLHESFGKETHTVNHPGTVHKEAVDAFVTVRNIYFSSQESQTLIVDGEEDLLALPAMLLAPMGSVVLYGLFDRGVVVNVVTEDLKHTIQELVKKFI